MVVKLIVEKLSTLDKFVTGKIQLLKNRYRLTAKFQTKFEYKVQREFFKKYQQFGTTKLYQTHPKLNIRGVRPTVSRFKVYNIEKYITKKSEVVDFGSNLGFFSLYLSEFVKSVDLVEINSTLTKICSMVREKLKIENVTIWNGDIKKYNSQKKYDLVLSFAIHGWVGMPLDKYMKHLTSFLKPKGTLLMESHALPGDDEFITYLHKQKNLKIVDEGLIDDHEGVLRKFYYLQKVKK